MQAVEFHRSTKRLESMRWDIFRDRRIYSNMMLKIGIRQPYKVKRGQTLRVLAKEYSTTEYAIIVRNGLTEELYEGQLIFLPEPSNVYVVQPSDTKELLCGTAEEFFRKNGTHVFYPAMRVLI